MDEQLDGPSRLAHGDSDVLDLHVLLELEDQRYLLLPGQRLDLGPDAAHAIPPRGHLLQSGSTHRYVVLGVDVLQRPGGAEAIGHCVDSYLIQPGREGPARVLIAADATQGLQKDVTRDVLGDRLVVNSGIHEFVDLEKIAVIELTEGRWLVLRTLNELPLVIPRREAQRPFSLRLLKRLGGGSGYVHDYECRGPEGGPVDRAGQGQAAAICGRLPGAGQKEAA